ncbi:hypothetical protein HG535_0C01630 [Zygotorulaspora mrakii]|uniref:RecQ mediated genome instability protein 1 OB-fold domain-containing protein n=1 Tax=Zygotorulaspora mrakii TaxID=42260 RepID=A0A7H9B0D5_ZYGMR|nr:uncharacterized protein HG535_0C01630 [Zygotorulaspora mrakii]QLG71814.1 hypothetical protein HG535_0C01630 [Zygotorulaspora mrakii]
MSGILSEDITALSSLDRSALSSRDSTLLRALDRDTWLSDKDCIQQPFTTLPNDCLFQILMIENISQSKMSQLDDIDNKLDPAKQRVDRLQNSRVVIHEVNMDNDDSVTKEKYGSKDVFKLTLQDKSGKFFYAINYNIIPWINVCMIGSKLIIKSGTSFNRGVFIVKDTDCSFLGGTNRIWNENRESKLYNYLDSKLKRDCNNNVNGRKRKN